MFTVHQATRNPTRMEYTPYFMHLVEPHAINCHTLSCNAMMKLASLCYFSYLIHLIASDLVSSDLMYRRTRDHRGHISAFPRPKGTARALHQGNVL